MSLAMEDFKSPVNALEEVKKLQDLVRKLEIQNKHLRSKQNAPRKRSVSPVKEPKLSPELHIRRVSKQRSESIDSHDSLTDDALDELEVICFSDSDTSCDESWLYKSPKTVKGKTKHESPYVWLRKDVDDPGNKQLQLTKKALLTKLIELEILSPSKSQNHFEHFSESNCFQQSQMTYRKSSVKTFDTPRVDTRTFTRSKKKQALEFLDRVDVSNNSQNVKTWENSSHFMRRDSDVSCDSLSSCHDSISSCHILEDVSDVEEVARMQEESLRMSSPLSIPKRSASSNNDNGESEPFQTDAYGQSVSDQSSPSESPFGSNGSLHMAEKEKAKIDAYHCSLPNLNRDPVFLRKPKADDLVGPNHTQSRRKFFPKKTDTVVPSMSKIFKTPTTSKVRSANHLTHSNIQSTPIAEPTITITKNAELSEKKLRVRSGLPRPARASSATRSGIPTPSSLGRRNAEDSWSEGCF